MCKLKEWTASEIEEYDDARLELAEDGKIDCTRVYIKADADEVISTIRAKRDEYRYNLSCARNEIHNLTMSMREDVKTIADKDKVIADLEESNKMEVEQLLMEIEKLKEERRWRKFPDEKPKWGEEVLVVDDESKQYIVRFSHDMKWISWGKMNTCESSAVLYWMPKPSAPKEAR